MARSKREIPHYYLQLEIDMSRAIEWLHEANLQRPVNDRLLPSVAAPERGRPSGRRDAGDERVLDRRSVPTRRRRPPRRRGLAARRRPDRPGAARRRPARTSTRSWPASATSCSERGRAGCAARRCPTRRSPSPTSGSGASTWCTASSTRRRSRSSGSAPSASGHGPPTGCSAFDRSSIATLAADHRASDGHAGGRFLTLIDRQLQKPETL